MHLIIKSNRKGATASYLLNNGGVDQKNWGECCVHALAVWSNIYHQRAIKLFWLLAQNDFVVVLDFQWGKSVGAVAHSWEAFFAKCVCFIAKRLRSHVVQNSHNGPHSKRQNPILDFFGRLSFQKAMKISICDVTKGTDASPGLAVRPPASCLFCRRGHIAIISHQTRLRRRIGFSGRQNHRVFLGAINRGLNTLVSGDLLGSWMSMRHEGPLHRSKINPKNGNNMEPVSWPVIKKQKKKQRICF